VNLGHTLFFRASASCSNILNVKSIFNIVKIFRANSVFHCKLRIAQNSWMVRNIFNTVYSVYIHLGVIRAIWASVVCNLDQSRDWLKWLWSGPSSHFLCQVFRAVFRTLLLSVAALILTTNFSCLTEVGKFWS